MSCDTAKQACPVYNMKKLIVNHGDKMQNIWRKVL